jgi:hypothetical protein
MFLTAALKKCSLAAGGFLLLMLTAGSGRADILSFQYDETASGDVLAGTMIGTLLGDDNTFVVTSMGPVTLDGNPTSPLTLVSSGDVFEGLSATELPTVTLDGSYMDLAALTPSVYGFFFGVGDLLAGPGELGGPFFDSSEGYGGNSIDGDYETFNIAGWSASVSSVPEVSSVYFLGFIVAAAGLAAYRQKRLRKHLVSGNRAA